MLAEHDHAPRTEPGASFDLAVIGGGALGCAVAWEGASRGLRVVLLEQDDFGCGASANSLKVVHGGLRYLQKMDLARARASAAERSAFLRITPHLVEPLACAMPTRRSLLRGRLAMACGLAMNAVLTADRNKGLAADRRLAAGGLISRETLAAAAPGLTLEGATGGARWFDAQMVDSERLVLSFALAAEQRGALLLNHHRAVGLTCNGGRVVGVEAIDVISGKHVEVSAATVVDCRAGWASPDAAIPGPPGISGFIKAVNLVLPGTGLGCAVGFPMRDDAKQVMSGRMLFAAPWNGVTLVGTWYSREPRGPGAGVTPDEIAAMVKRVNASYGGWQFEGSDVRAVHVGFMPEQGNVIPAADEPVPADRPICMPAKEAGGPSGLWYLQTEKWTTVRRLAQHFVDRLAASGAVAADASQTMHTPLPGAEPQALRAASEALRASGISGAVAQRLLAAYGGALTAVLDLVRADPRLGQPVPCTAGVMAAEVRYAISSEHARTLGDVVRRTGTGAAGRPTAEALAAMARVAAGLTGWTEDEQARQVENVLCWPMYPALPSPAAGPVEDARISRSS